MEVSQNKQHSIFDLRFLATQIANCFKKIQGKVPCPCSHTYEIMQAVITLDIKV